MIYFPRYLKTEDWAPDFEALVKFVVYARCLCNDKTRKQKIISIDKFTMIKYQNGHTTTHRMITRRRGPTIYQTNRQSLESKNNRHKKFSSTISHFLVTVGFILMGNIKEREHANNEDLSYRSVTIRQVISTSCTNF